MRGTDAFKTTISQHLEALAVSDPLFAETMKKPNKNIDECITYIFNQVKASGCNGFADSEIFGMAVHYYDEDDIKPGKAIQGQVVINHAVELSEDDIKKAKEAAFDKVIEDEKARIRKKSEQKKNQNLVVQQSLF